MDQGKAKLLKNGVNTLHQAIHPLHGIAWTDGKQVILTSFHLQNEEPDFGSSVVVGQFEHVHGLYWGQAMDIPALLAVQHKKHVTIWQLYYNPLEKNKLVVSQTCEYGEALPILPQGCIWHPNKDILAVLTKRDISVLYSVFLNKNLFVKADITGCSVIRCACWTKDGSRVVAAMDDSLYSYLWNDEDKTLSPCSFCPIFNIDSTIVAIQPIMDYQVVVTSEVATKGHCATPKDLNESAVQASLRILDMELSKNNRRMSVDSGRSEPVDFLKFSSLVPTDISQILARHRKSDPSPLFSMKQKGISGESKPELSNLVIVSFEKNATTTRKVSLPGISTPDILVLDPNCERVAVASNTSNLVLIYPIAPSCMPNIQEVKLEENEKVKGISFLTDTRLLIMAGRQRSSDLMFLPLSISEKYIIQLLTKQILPPEYIPSRLNCDQSSTTAVHFKSIDSHTQPYGDHGVIKEFWMPNHIKSKTPRIRRKLRDIARGTSYDSSPTSSLDDCDENRLVDNPVSQTEVTIQRVSKVSTNKPNKTLCRSLSQWSGKYDSEDTQDDTAPVPSKAIVNAVMVNPGREAQVGKQQFYYSEIKDILSPCSRPMPYPSSEEPSYITITHQRSSEERSDIRAILLCHGKLHLSTVRDVFHLQNIEMMFGSKWIVLTEDQEGFTPIIFRANQEVEIREAKHLSAPSLP